MHSANIFNIDILGKQLNRLAQSPNFTDEDLIRILIYKKFESIVLASLVDKAPIEVVSEGLEVSTNATIMISTIWMANQLPFYAKIQSFSDKEL